MIKNLTGQKWTVFAFDATTGLPETGDAANITANLRLDGGAANAVDDTNPTELEDGYYIFDLTQAETNADHIIICPQSSTDDIVVIGVPGAVWTTPVKQAATLAAADVTGNLPANVAQWKGTTAPDNTGDAFARLGANGAGLTALPWNAAWDAEVNSECTDALNAYDPPTNTEMTARTLASASYATPTNITAGTITTVTNLTNAPTVGDFTTAMKTSLNNATPALSSTGVTAIATAVWDTATRSLTTFGGLVNDVRDAVWSATTRTLTAISDSAGITTLLSRIGAALTFTSGNVHAHIKAKDNLDFGALEKTSLNAATPSVTVSDKTGFSLATAPPTAVQIRTEMDSNSTKLANLDATTSSRLAAASYTAPPTAAAIRGEIDSNSTKLDVAIGTRLAAANYTAPDNDSIEDIKERTDNLPDSPAAVGSAMTLTSAYDAAKTAATQTSVNAVPTNPLLTNDARLNNLDATVSSRLASAAYTAPPTAVNIRSEIDTNSTKLDVAVGTRLASAGYTAPNNTYIGNIKTVVDKLDTMLEADGSDYKFTEEALEEAPTGGSAPTVTEIRNELDSNSTKLANLDATITSRSTLTAAQVWSQATRTLTAISDSAGITTLLSRIGQALGFTSGNVNVHVKGKDNLDFGALEKTSLNAATPAVTISDKTGFALTSDYDAAKSAASQTSVNGIPSAILVTPAQKLVTNADGSVNAQASVDTEDIADAVVEALEDAGLPTVPLIVAGIMGEPKGDHTGVLAGVAQDLTVAKDATVAKDLTVAKDATVAKESTTAKDATVAKESTTAKDATVAKAATALSNVVWTDAKAGYLNAEIASRLAAEDYDAPDNAGILAVENGLSTVASDVLAIKTKTDALPGSPAAVGSAMTLTSAYDAAKTAATQGSVDNVVDIVNGIKTKTDALTFGKPGEVNTNVKSINDVTITGTGHVGEEFGVD